MKRMVSYTRGLHMPVAYQDAHGVWRCRDCGLRLTRYVMRGKRSMRHHPRGRR